MMARITREVELLSQMNHENVVRSAVIYAIELAKCMYMYMYVHRARRCSRHAFLHVCIELVMHVLYILIIICTCLSALTFGTFVVSKFM